MPTCTSWPSRNIRGQPSREMLSILCYVPVHYTSTSTHSCDAWQRASNNGWTNPWICKREKIIEAKPLYERREIFLKKNLSSHLSFPSLSIVRDSINNFLIHKHNLVSERIALETWEALSKSKSLGGFSLAAHQLQEARWRKGS